MSKTTPKQRIFEQLARAAKAMASANRLELLEVLGQGERSVDGLAQSCGMSIANTSHHLQVLREGGLVQSRKEGLQVIYRLSDPAVVALVADLGRVAERHLAEVERIVRENFSGQDGLQPVRQGELKRLLKSGEAVVLDVRPPEEYAAGHIKGALNVPLKDFPKQIAKLPKSREIIAYCRGPYCMLAVDAVAQLRRRGYRARRFEAGYPQWAAANPPPKKRSA